MKLYHINVVGVGFTAPRAASTALLIGSVWYILKEKIDFIIFLQTLYMSESTIFKINYFWYPA